MPPSLLGTSLARNGVPLVTSYSNLSLSSETTHRVLSIFSHHYHHFSHINHTALLGADTRSIPGPIRASKPSSKPYNPFLTKQQSAMASNQATPSNKEAPLAYMEHLSLAVSYFHPSESTAATSASASGSNSARDPELILILGWMGARDVHIAKYITQHRAMFPSSRIMLVRSPASHVLLPPLARRHIAPAIPILKEFAEEEVESTPGEISADVTEKKTPRVLIHMFSNGGVSTAARIREMLKVEMQKDMTKSGQKLIFPQYSLCLDSCPGNFDRKRTHAALLMSLPRWISPLLHLFLGSAWLMYKLRLIRPAQNLNAEIIRSETLVSREVRRTYLYGTADAVINWHHVEDDATKAAASGFHVRREKFDGGGHVMLARQDGERYWNAVRETWGGDRL